MRRRAFTLLEVMAVVVLLGLTAGAVAWSFAGHVRHASRDAAVSQFVRADRLARLAAQRQGRPCALRIDLTTQRLVRHMGAPTEAPAEQAHSATLAGGRCDRIVVAGTAASTAPAGIVEIPFSPGGRSPSYAVRLVFSERALWLVFSGLTGQATVIENEQHAHNLLAALGTARPDAP
jgi:prepilin-type N-terminal cleavage/methylation domain-containing protein